MEHVFSKTDIFLILHFFSAQIFKSVVSFRLIVDDRGEHVGCGFLQFASVCKAENVRVVFSTDDGKNVQVVISKYDKAD